MEKKIDAKIVLSGSAGLMLQIGSEAQLGWCPRYNITEQKLDDPISHYPVGKEVKGRIIGTLIGEGVSLVTLRESVVEAEFFRYDSFFPTQTVTGKVVTVNDGGWVNVSLAPHLFGVISPNHLANSNLSKENIENKFKPGSSHKLMVLDKASDRLFLTAKPHLIKSKLVRFVDVENIRVGDISLGTIVLVHDKCLIVQFFNNISAFIPIGQLSLEHIKKISDNFEKGQTVRVRVIQINSQRENQITGSLILDPTLKVKREKDEGNVSLGTGVESFSFSGEVDSTTMVPSLLGKTESGAEALIHETDLSMDQNISLAFFNQLKIRKEKLKNCFVEAELKGKRLKISNSKLTKEAISHGDLYRCRHKFEYLEEGKLLVGTITKALDFGFHLQFGGRLRGFLHRAQCVDRFVPDHRNLLTVGDLTVAKVTEVDLEKQRFLLTTKESEIEKDSLPDWLNDENIFKSYRDELNAFAQYCDLPFKFGETVLLKFSVKCEYERQRNMPKVEFESSSGGLGGVICGENLKGELISGIFIGVHSNTELLFCPKELDKIKTSKIIYSNSFISISNNCGKICLLNSRNGLLAQGLKFKQNSKVEIVQTQEIDSVSIGFIKTLSKKKGSENWGVINLRNLTTGDAHSGIIHSVTPKGIRISLGRDVVVNCYFGGISPFFIPREKTVEICQKYFPRGKKVKVTVTDVTKKYAVVKMAHDYIDADAEGLTMSKKRKVELLEKSEKSEKPEKMIKIDFPAKPAPEVKEEPTAALGLAEAAEMDIEFDTVQSELEKRAVETAPETGPPAQTAGKVQTVEEAEQSAREAEREMEAAKLPEDIAGWERAIVTNPNNSEVWLRYSTFHITSGEVEKARLTMDRALQKINFREEQDRMNIWKARLNLETLYGDEESLNVQFNHAKRSNDEFKIYLALIDIHLQNQKFNFAVGLLRDAVKKFPEHVDFWVQLGKCQLELGEKHKAKVTMERALAANKTKHHVLIIQKFARIEFDIGDCERAKMILEQTLKVHPKRADIWGAYSDLLVKYSSIEDARKALERGIDQCSKSRGRVHLIKRIISLESRNGNDQIAQEWKTKLENEIGKKATTERTEIEAN